MGVQGGPCSSQGLFSLDAKLAGYGQGVSATSESKYVTAFLQILG